MAYIFTLIKRLFEKGVDPKDFPECLDCGVCCTYFKINFSAKDNPQMKAHEDKIHFISKKEYIMNGTEKFNKGRCVALKGTINKDAYCSIYEDRPEVCRRFQRVLPNGKINPRCIQARNAYLKRFPDMPQSKIGNS